MEILHAIAGFTFLAALIYFGLIVFHIIKNRNYYTDDKYLGYCLKCMGISLGVTILILLINVAVPNNSVGVFSSIDKKISSANEPVDEKLYRPEAHGQETAEKISSGDSIKKIFSHVNEPVDDFSSIDKKISSANEPVDEKLYRPETHEQETAEKFLSEAEENKDAVKKYLEHVQPFDEVYSRRKAVGAKFPLLESDVENLGAYVVQLKHLVESADNYFYSQKDVRMEKVHQACRTYVLAEAKIAGGYVDLKRGDESLMDAVEAVTTLANVGEYKDAYTEQAAAENEIKRLAEWSSAEIILP